MKLTRVALAATAAALLTASTQAPAQAATTGNRITNAVEPSNYAIYVSLSNPYMNPHALYPYYTSPSGVQCFKPALTSHSWWGATYWGGVVYCFATSGSNLYLYSGLA